MASYERDAQYPYLNKHWLTHTKTIQTYRNLPFILTKSRIVNKLCKETVTVVVMRPYRVVVQPHLPL